MTARGMEGLSDLRKVTVLKKGSFVSASPLAPASASLPSTFGGDQETRLPCSEQQSNGVDLVHLGIQALHLCPERNLGSSDLLYWLATSLVLTVPPPLETEVGRGGGFGRGEKATCLSLQATARGNVWRGLWGDKQVSPIFVLNLPCLQSQHHQGGRGQAVWVAVGSVRIGQLTCSS